MPRLSRYLCPSCGKQLAGDEFDPTRRPACNDCGRLAQLWEKAESVAMPLAAPPLPIPAPVPVPAPMPTPVTKPQSLIRLLVAVAVVVVAGGAFWYIESNRRAADRKALIEAADRVVAAKVEAARAHIARRDFDEALKILNAALATEHATRLDDARLALVQARQGQANTLLEAASVAVTRRNVTKVKQLLTEYLDHPYADQQPKAMLLMDELARATDDESAVRLLSQLPDDKLATFAETGRLLEGEQLTDSGMRDLYKDTLNRHVPKELEVRAARREAARAAVVRRERVIVEREQRLRVSPLYLEMTTFAESVRKQARDQSKQRELANLALEEFFRETGVNDPAERDKKRLALRSGRESENYALVVVRKKAQLKKDYRQSKDYDRADEETFDRLVDEELDRLLTEMTISNKP